MTMLAVLVLGIVLMNLIRTFRYLCDTSGSWWAYARQTQSRWQILWASYKYVSVESQIARFCRTRNIREGRASLRFRVYLIVRRLLGRRAYRVLRGRCWWVLCTHNNKTRYGSAVVVESWHVYVRRTEYNNDRTEWHGPFLSEKAANRAFDRRFK